MDVRVGFRRRLIVFLSLFICLLAPTASVAARDESAHSKGQNAAQDSENQNSFYAPYSDEKTQQHPLKDAHPHTSTTPFNTLQQLHAALEVMQKEYFSIWLGKWLTAIDWTAAVTGTHISATLSSLSTSLAYTMPGTFDKTRKLDVEAQMVENEINKYFAQSAAFYFGEEYFSIRNQAYDDMLWVVLGWLESIRFVNVHSESHYPPSSEAPDGKGEWHAQQFIPAFAHRARVFYELAQKGWDWKLCGGGMVWDPRYQPYKNAITNQLFISASISMYLYFPGDSNCSPFMGIENGYLFRTKLWAQEMGDPAECAGSTSSSTYDPIYLSNAINGYEWLANVGMRNEQGLYVDGFHIGGYRQNHSKTECNERNEMVYTYNQGVILSGLRGLWEATGNLTYLEDGHELVRNVIHATGWEHTDTLSEPSFATQPPSRPRRTRPILTKNGWSGLGAHGILNELCDAQGACNQDGQTFKGIFFHHLTAFCNPLPRSPARRGKTFAASPETAALHRKSCHEYAPWVTHNAQAALKTRDAKGKFGMWWGAHLPSPLPEHNPESNVPYVTLLPDGAKDYRNDYDLVLLASGITPEPQVRMDPREPTPDDDLNDRGRGRTVETQGGGVAVVRAMWEFLRWAEAGDLER